MGTYLNLRITAGIYFSPLSYNSYYDNLYQMAKISKRPVVSEALDVTVINSPKSTERHIVFHQSVAFLSFFFFVLTKFSDVLFNQVEFNTVIYYVLINNAKSHSITSCIFEKTKVQRPSYNTFLEALLQDLKHCSGFTLNVLYHTRQIKVPICM